MQAAAQTDALPSPKRDAAIPNMLNTAKDMEASSIANALQLKELERITEAWTD